MMNLSINQSTFLSPFRSNPMANDPACRSWCLDQHLMYWNNTFIESTFLIIIAIALLIIVYFILNNYDAYVKKLKGAEFSERIIANIPSALFYAIFVLLLGFLIYFQYLIKQLGT